VSEWSRQRDALIAELAQALRPHLLAAGWILSDADATFLGLAAAFKWAASRR
jgi:hypothetical protein